MHEMHSCSLAEALLPELFITAYLVIDDKHEQKLIEL